MEEMATFLEMGGYAAFVWPAFGITLAVLAGLLGLSVRSLGARETALAALRGEGKAAGET